MLLGPPPKGSERVDFGEPRKVHCFKASQGGLRGAGPEPHVADGGWGPLSSSAPSQSGGLENHVF